MKKIFVFFLILLFSSRIFAADNTSYDDINFPQWSKDLRRTEIITFGSLPFVTMWTTMAYSGIKYNQLGNPFDKSTSRFTTEDQKSIMLYSAAICVGLGLTDLFINIIKRNLNKKNVKVNSHVPITVMPISKDYEFNENLFNEDDSQIKDENIIQQDYIQAGIESAFF